RRDQGPHAAAARGDDPAARRSGRDADAVLLPPRPPDREPPVAARHQARARTHVVSRPPLLALVGPTGVGKTAVAVRLAQQIAIEVVSADSRQGHRRKDNGHSKPTADEATGT